MPTLGVALDTTQYVQVNTGQYPIVLEAHRDAVRIVFSNTKPARGNPIFHLLGGDDNPLTVEYNDTNVWALATSDNSSLFVTEFPNGFLKIRDERTAASLEGTLFAISGTHPIADGEILAFNLFPAADMIVHNVSVNADLLITAYNMHATGNADGIFTATGLNAILGNTSPSQAQLYYSATSQGAVLGSGLRNLDTRIVTTVDDTPSFAVLNDSGASKTLTLTITIEETGTQADPFGLLPTTNLTAGTEMSVYG